jgi:uncharacterized membrane protein
MISSLVNLKFMHVLLGVTLFGLFVSIYAYTLKSFKTKNLAIIFPILKGSFLIDVLIGFILIHQFVTGTLLIRAENLPFSTPWLIAAFFLLALISFIWIGLVWMRYRAFKDKKTTLSRPFLYSFLYALVFIGLIAIIHDAIHKNNFFDKEITQLIAILK